MSRVPFVHGCVSGKRGYSSQAKARKALRQKDAKLTRARYTYLCPDCGLWHTTKAPRRSKPS